MSIVNIARSAARFLRAGYPDNVRMTGYAPVLALLPRRLTDDEVAALASHLTDASATRGIHIDGTAIGVAITKVTGALPSRSDQERVSSRLAGTGGA